MFFFLSFSNRIIYLIDFLKVSVLVLHVPVALDDVFLGLRPNYYLLHLCISAKCLNIIHLLCVSPTPIYHIMFFLAALYKKKQQHIFSDSYAPRRSSLMFVRGTCSGDRCLKVGVGTHLLQYHHTTAGGDVCPQPFISWRPTWSCHAGSLFCHVRSCLQASVKLTLCLLHRGAASLL